MNSSTLGVIGVVGHRGVVEGGGVGKGEVAGVGRGGEGKGREVKGNGHSSSPLSTRMD